MKTASNGFTGIVHFYVHGREVSLHTWISLY